MNIKWREVFRALFNAGGFGRSYWLKLLISHSNSVATIVIIDGSPVKDLPICSVKNYPTHHSQLNYMLTGQMSLYNRLCSLCHIHSLWIDIDLFEFYVILRCRENQFPMVNISM